MIYGVGTDICDVRRIAAVLQRRGDQFTKRVLGESELQAYARRSVRYADRGMRYVATRFSAKEAFSKSIGLGIHSPMRWRDCEILNLSSGQPQIVLHGELQSWCAERGLKFSISLSDESDYATATVIAEVVDAVPRSSLT